MTERRGPRRSRSRDPARGAWGGGISSRLVWCETPWLAGEQPRDHAGAVLGGVVRLGGGLRRYGVQLGVGEAGAGLPGRGEQRHGVVRAEPRITGGGARHQVVELGREPRDGGRRRRDGLVEVLVDDLGGGVAAVRLGPGQHLVQDDTAGVHIGAGVRRAVLYLLGGEIGDRAEDGPGGVGDGADRPYESEVGDLDPAVVPYQDVLRLHVAVHEARPVCRAEGGEDRLQDVQGGPRLERAAIAQHVAQGAARDVLHRQVDVLPLGALVEDRDHIGVREPGHGLGLADEALDERDIGRQRRVHHLEGEHPVEPGVHGPVDRGHAAHGDAGIDAVAAVEQLPDERVLEGRIHAGESTSRHGHDPRAGAVPGPYCSRAVTGTCAVRRTGGSERRALRVQHRTPLHR